jgi:WD40 repeat protein
MAQRLRVFVSSPGDVPGERLRADLVIDKLSQDYGRYFSIESYRWEHEPMLASGHFQDAIDPPSETDIVILILWSRLGTPLPEKTALREYRGIDGRVPVTGTEWEFEDALAGAQAHGAPDILVFRNVSPAPIDSRDSAARARSLAQLDALDAFWKRYFANRGVLLAASYEYSSLEEFAGRLEELLRKLIECRIKALASGHDAAASRTWLGDPFRGLQSYEFEHAAIYFGRDALVARASEQLAAGARQGSAFLLVVGASGSGKSSLVKGAVVPRLMKPQRIEGAAFLRRVVFRPADAQRDLFLGLVESLTSPSERSDLGLPELLAPGQSAKDLATHLRATAESAAFLFSGALARVTTMSQDAKQILPHETAKLILVIDQFEELFTLASIGADDRAAFVKLLNALAHSGAIWVIATMRADFWHRVLDLPDLVTLTQGQGRLDVPPPSPAEIAEMIRKPAIAAGLRFQVHPDTGIGLDSVVAEDAASAPGVLPLLSFTLDALYTEDVEKRGGTELTFAQYQALGGLEGAIATRAEQVVAGLPEQTRSAMARVLRTLVTVGDGDGEMPVSRTVPLSTFAPGGDARTVADALVAARLLVASSEGDTATLRFAHEALISRWARARDQLAADRRDLQTRALVERQFTRWQAADPAQRQNLLLRDPDLANALDLKRRFGDELGGDTAAYIEQSQQRSRRRHQLAAAAAVIFGIIALAATGFGILAYHAQQVANRETNRAVAAEASAVKQRDEALHQRNAALIAQSRYLAGEADQLVGDGNVRGAIALLRVALPDPAHGNKRPLVEDAVAAAYNALYSNRERGRMAMPNGASAVTSDGHAGLFVIATANRLYIRKDLSAAGQREIPQNFGAPQRLVLSADGARLAMIGRDGSIAIWDLNARRQLFKHGSTGSGTQAVFMNGGDRLLVYSSDFHNWMLFDASSGRTLAKRQFAASGHKLASLVDSANGVIAVIAGNRLHRLSLDDLSDAAAVPVDASEQYALADAPDGKTIYVAAAKSILDGRIFAFAADTLASKRSFGKFAGGALFLTVSRDAKLLALHGVVGIDFFDLQSGERLNHFVLSGAAAPHGQFTAAGDYIAYGPNGFIRLYVPELGTVSGAYRTIDGGAIVQVDELPDRSGFVTISDRPSVTSWTFETETTSREYTVPLVFLGKDMKFPAPSEAFAVSSDRSRILVSYLDHSARLWNPETGAVRLVRTADLKASPVVQVASLANGTSVLAEKSGRLLVYTKAGGSTEPVATIAADPANFLNDVGGNKALMITASGAASLIDFSSPTKPKIEPLPQFAGCVNAGAAPGFALCITRDGSIAMLRVRDRSVLFHQAKPAGAKFTSAYVSPSGDRIALCDSKGRLVVYSSPDGAVIARATLTIRLQGGDVRRALNSPLLSEVDRAKIRAGATNLEIPAGANLMRLSPDGKMLAVGMPDRTVRLIDLGSGKSRQLAKTSSLVLALQFSPHGRLLGMIEHGGLLGVYDTVDGTRIASITLSGQVSPQLVSLANARGFTTIDKSGRLIIHPVFEDDKDLIAFLAHNFPEGLTAAQRRAYFIE